VVVSIRNSYHFARLSGEGGPDNEARDLKIIGRTEMRSLSVAGSLILTHTWELWLAGFTCWSRMELA